jgi:hypothetical protein
MPKAGWLKRQLEKSAKEFSNWPEWMKDPRVRTASVLEYAPKEQIVVARISSSNQPSE